MGIIKRKPPTLKFILVEYLCSVALALLLSVLIPNLLFMFGVGRGWYSYANVGETQAKAAEPKIAAAQRFDPSLVPVSCKYVFLSPELKVLEGNIGKTDLPHAIDYVRGKYDSRSLNDCYLAVKRQDGYCVLHYTIYSHYNADWMNRYLPDLEKTSLAVILFNCLFSCAAMTLLFAGRLKKHLRPLMSATRKIREQNLDFEIRPSGIREFNHILQSISEMRAELKRSLERQWRMEQIKRTQTSALAHDIKTPLTIIRGNAELLESSQLTEKQREYTGFILKNTGRMEQYLRMLIDLTQTEAGYAFRLRKIDTERFLKELEDQADGLAAARQLEVDFSRKNLPPEFSADAGLLQRAVMNVLSNAADYSPEHGKIGISAEASSGKLRFCVIDGGKGFSPADIKQAAEEFYIGDKSRALKAHYGIGLYITQTIVKLHKGRLLLDNSTDTGGGKVTIEMPI